MTANRSMWSMRALAAAADGSEAARATGAVKPVGWVVTTPTAKLKASSRFTTAVHRTAVAFVVRRATDVVTGATRTRILIWDRLSFVATGVIQTRADRRRAIARVGAVLIGCAGGARVLDHAVDAKLGGTRACAGKSAVGPTAAFGRTRLTVRADLRQSGAFSIDEDAIFVIDPAARPVGTSRGGWAATRIGGIESATSAFIQIAIIEAVFATRRLTRIEAEPVLKAVTPEFAAHREGPRGISNAFASRWIADLTFVVAGAARPCGRSGCRLARLARIVRVSGFRRVILVANVTTRRTHALLTDETGAALGISSAPCPPSQPGRTAALGSTGRLTPGQTDHACDTAPDEGFDQRTARGPTARN
jgi:hypothetical protein